MDDGFVDVRGVEAQLNVLQVALSAPTGLGAAQAITQGKALLRRLAMTATLENMPDESQLTTWICVRQTDDATDAINLTCWSVNADETIITARLQDGELEEIYAAGAGSGYFQDTNEHGDWIADLTTGQLSGAGWQGMQQQIENAKEQALQELRTPPTDTDWLCGNCGWPNEAGDVVCSECSVPAMVSGGTVSAETLPLPTVPKSAEPIFTPPSVVDAMVDAAAETIGSATADTLFGRKQERQQPQEKACAVCERMIAADAKFCRHCGYAQPTTCSNCHAILEADSRFCSKCGTPVQYDQE